MPDNKRFSQEVSVFHGRPAPEKGNIAGYGAIIDSLNLALPMPDCLSLISTRHKKYKTSQWQVFTPRHQPKDSLLDQIIFAIKYEGIRLLFFKKLFRQIEKNEIEQWVKNEPQSQYTRIIWFLYEWLNDEMLDLPDLNRGNYVELVDTGLQYALSNGIRSTRHRIINNLPGTVNFCPLVYKTPELEQFINAGLAEQQTNYLKGIRKDILRRASAFLLLKDLKASLTIEGESLPNKRAARWGQAIGQAGARDLSKEELLRLQQLVIENPRFLEMGYRCKGGFVGEHDRTTGEPVPDHISAKWQDLDVLMSGFFETEKLLSSHNGDAVISAAVIAFGFVFIHPFEDGNGRIHRYLIHHILARKRFSQQGIIFPVSSAILEKVHEYRRVLESYSLPLLDFIEWKETRDHNVEVLNDTIDFYRYFDATKQAEFLYGCVNDTIQHIIPHEVEYLVRYDNFKTIVENEYEMPDKLIALLVRFLEQNNGVLSKRARENEFESLTDEEVQTIEKVYREIFING